MEEALMIYYNMGNDEFLILFKHLRRTQPAITSLTSKSKNTTSNKLFLRVKAKQHFLQALVDANRPKGKNITDAKCVACYLGEGL